MARKAYLATVQILIEADSVGEAKDSLIVVLYGERLPSGPPFIDWGYLRVGAQWMYPVEVIIDDTYMEGDMFNG